MTKLKPLFGDIEMDETTFGGRRPGKRGWSASGKNIVFGIYQRNEKVLTFPISSRAKKTTMPFITKYTKAGSLYYIDETGLPLYLPSYSWKSRGVLKEKRRPEEQNHLDGIEGFWSFVFCLLPSTGFTSIEVSPRPISLSI